MTKILTSCISLLFVSYFSLAQLKVTDACPGFTIDILEGNINKVHPKSTISEIIKTFPCQTSIEERGDSIGRCNGVFYNNRGVSFYTGRNYIEITDAYKGKMEPAIMGAAKGSLFNILGHPKLKDIEWEAYQTRYGTLILYYNKTNKVNKIQISSRPTETIKLCE